MKLDSYPFSKMVAEKFDLPIGEATKMVRRNWIELRKRVGEDGIIRLERLTGDPKAFQQELKDDGSDAALWFLSVIVNPGRPNKPRTPQPRSPYTVPMIEDDPDASN
jgi:hypothetical protein